MREWINANETIRANDAETIQSAIRLSLEDGCRKVVVPRYNARTKSTVWSLPTSLQLPSDFTLILDNCYMEQGLESYENLITNERSHDMEYTNDIKNRAHNISVIGEGNVTLSGGVHNNLLEATTRKYGQHSMWHQPIFYWHNVDGIRVENVHVEHQRWWAFLHIFVSNVVLKNIDFFAYPHVPNMDGIDLRIGCDHFTIENITGRTGDDILALTALFGGGEVTRNVEGLPRHISNVKVRNIKADANTCYTVRLLNHDDNRLFNIDVDTIMDSSDPTSLNRMGAAVSIGSPFYFAVHPAVMGDTRDIHFQNVYTRGYGAVIINHVLQNALLENLHTYGTTAHFGLYSFAEGMVADNVEIRHLFVDRVQTHDENGEPVEEALVGEVVSIPKLEGTLRMNDVQASVVRTGFSIQGGSGTLIAKDVKMDKVITEKKVADTASLVIE